MLKNISKTQKKCKEIIGKYQYELLFCQSLVAVEFNKLNIALRTVFDQI